MLDQRILSDEFVASVELDSPHLLADLGRMALALPGLADALSNASPEDLEAIESFIESSGILRFYEDNPSLMQSTSSTAGSLLAAPLRRASEEAPPTLSTLSPVPWKTRTSPCLTHRVKR